VTGEQKPPVTTYEMQNMPMETLEFTIFDHGRQSIDALRSCLDEFGTKNRVNVQLEVLPWDGSWSKLVQIALYGGGPDLSEMSSTWIGDFVQMNTLRPYTGKEVAALGGESAFWEPAWASGGIHHDSRFTLWGMPWLADARILVYRRDLFEQAGVDVQTAFASLDNFEQALAKLQTAGIEMPLVLPTLRSRLDLQMMASWVWGEGGNFVNATGDQILFDQAEAMRGFQRYYKLARFLSPAARGLDDTESNNQYFNGRAATVMGGHWLIQDARVTQNLAGKYGVVGIPPVSFVGGSHLVIWRNSRKTDIALKLVDFLAGSQTPPEFYPGFGLPARLDGIANATFMQDANYQEIVEALKTGRTFPAGRLWGMMEKRLVDLIPAIWQEIFSSDHPDIDAIVQNRLTALADRLRMTLNS
jgi:multiple sugar transport system substrate-binding protein